MTGRDHRSKSEVMELASITKPSAVLQPNGQASQHNNETINEPELDSLLTGLSQADKQVPCNWLYDERGSDLYNKITELKEYYPYKTEIQLLQQYAQAILKSVPQGAIIVELGCGSASKTAIIQRALLERDGPQDCKFIGIDVSSNFLEQAKKNMLEACPGLLAENVEAIEATYLDGLKEARRRYPNETLCILWLGSSIGNLNPQETHSFFNDLMIASGPKTQVFVCTDLWKDRSILYNAYHDAKGVTEAFIKNGLKNAIQAATGGKKIVDVDAWRYEVIVNPETHQVEMYLVADQRLVVTSDIVIEKGERILMEISRKFLPSEMRQLAYQTGFYYLGCWRNALYGMHMICTPALAFQITRENTESLFDRIEDWSSIPISLRHPFCFYYAHVAAFAKIKLFQDLNPSAMDIMFSRGIDPDVCEPSQCHSHPPTPKSWPSKECILRYTNEVRELILRHLGDSAPDMWLVNMLIEHECMHQETLCYMLAQAQKQKWEEQHLDSQGCLVMQNGVDFSEPMARWARNEGKSTEENGVNDSCQTYIPAGEIALGVEIDRAKGFHWDNEGPVQEPKQVEAFMMANMPVSIGEFRKFVVEEGYIDSGLWSKEAFQCIASKQKCPATWTITGDGDIWVHYPEGTWHWTKVKERPVWCSMAEAQAFCKSRQSYLMSELEYLRASEHCQSTKSLKDLDCNGWELTSTPIEPLKGFSPMKDYPEYSDDFYDGKHFVLRGSSPYTPLSVVRHEFRNFYQDVYPYHFAKFRQCRHIEAS